MHPLPTFLLLLSLATTGETLTELAGTWEVERVAVDARDQPHWKYRPDDPQLVGRELVIDGEQVRFATGHDASCKPAQWEKHASDWRSLFGSGLLRSASASQPSAADYGFKGLARQPVTVWAFCDAAAKGVDDRWVLGPWLVPQGADRALMHLDTQTVLTLSRRKPEARPRASFPCARASTPVEKTICGSFTLAAWDRSVALAWRQSAGNGDPALLEQQKAWLHSRDACGADAACLERQMRDRTADLSRQ
jgi:hypothetical protein